MGSAMPTKNKVKPQVNRRPVVAPSHQPLEALLRKIEDTTLESRLREGLQLLASEITRNFDKAQEKDMAALSPTELLDLLTLCFERAFITPRPELADQANRARSTLTSLISIGNVLAFMGPSVGRAPTRELATNDVMSTEDAARLLNVSRPYVIKLADAGKLGLVLKTEGNHRKLLGSEVRAYQEAQQKVGAAALQRVIDVSQEAGAYVNDHEGT